MARLAREPGRGVDDEDRQVAQGVVSFLFLFYFLGSLSPHELFFFLVDNKKENEGGCIWRWRQCGGSDDMVAIEGES